MSNVQRKKQDEPDASRVAQPVSPDVGRSTLDFGLVVSDLRKSFDSPQGERVAVLRGVSFSAKASEAIAIVGASGAGKSTLLHLLGGIEAADHGSVTANQFSIDRARPKELAAFRNQQVGCVFQFHHLLPDLTAAENVGLPLRINRVATRESMRRAETLLEEFGFDRRSSETLVGHLSGGEQQRVAVCRALINRPVLVLADEPTGNLDDELGRQIAASLVSYAHNQCALVIIASHSAMVAETCDRRLILSGGRLRERDPI